MVSPLRSWLNVSLFNLLIVALLGTALRYKIAFSFPFIDQKHVMHAHSHFAFSGWITMALMALMVGYLSNEYSVSVFKKFRWILYANLFTAYGMLFSFPLEGYGPVSISFSTLSIFANYIFVFQYWLHLNKLRNKSVSHYWFKAALVFNVISSLGTYSLAFMMSTHNMHQELYLASVYFFLHFQYNGWFFFACMGLLTASSLVKIISPSILKKIFWLFFLACIPAFFLSALWMKVPIWVYILVVLSAFAQLVGWIWLIKLLKPQLAFIKSTFSLFARRIILLSAIALTLKLLLQLGSTIPSLSTLAFGFRPIVIGYLHLVLLGVITLFIIGYSVANNYIKVNKQAIWGIVIFITGVIVNEIFLMLQGTAGMDYINIPYINEALFVTACILFSGMLLLNMSQFGKK